MNLKELINITKNMSVLYVEDDEVLRKEFLEFLKRFFTHIDVAKDGLEGLNLFNKNNYDLVITDINMPNLNGLDMISHIKKIKQDINILIITAYSETDYFIKAIELGVDSFILKPISFEQLKSVFNRLATNYRLKKENDKYFSLLLQYQQLIDNSAIVCKIDNRGNIVYVNEEFETILEFKKEEIINKKFFILQQNIFEKYIKDILNNVVKNGLIWKGNLKLRKKSGEIVYIKSIIKAFYENKKLKEIIILGEDITEIMKPRKFLNDYVNTHDKPVVVLVKIENFKNIKELFGEILSEKIEKKFEDLIKEKMPQEIQEIFNLEDGLFALVCNQKYNSDFDLFIEKIKKMQKKLNNSTLEINGLKYDVFTTISIAKGDKCIENAKYGLEEIKKNQLQFIVADNLVEIKRKKAENNLKILHIIKKGIETNSIVCAYQPIIDNKTKKIIKYETLIRIKRKNTLIPPGEFLEIAKKGSFYSQLTEIVLKSSIEKLKKIANVSINISEIDIEKDSTRDFIYKTLKQHKNLAHRITFELLEDEEAYNYDKLDSFIDLLKSFGVKIAIDDFGKGYSNFYRLKKYKPDFLKIDGSLIKDITKDPFSESIIKSIVSFAKNNNIKTVAEYVETKEIFDKIKLLGVDYSQGYYFGKPKLLE